MATLLDRALVHNVVLDFKEEDYAQKGLTLKKEVDRLTIEKRRRLSIETEVVKELGERITKLEEKLIHIRMAEAGYPEQFSYKPLGWRYAKGGDNKKGLPVFLVLDVDADTSVFSIAGGTDNVNVPSLPKVSPELPPTMSFYYSDLDERLVSRSLISGRIVATHTISGSYTGVVPKKQLEEIEKAKATGLFENIFLICQVDEWSLSSTPTPIPLRDPLVIGFAHAKLWFIDMFDPTPLEQYTAEQFGWKV